MRIQCALAATSILVLAACSSEEPAVDDTGADISIEEAVEVVEKQGMKPEPGQYRSTVEVLEVSIPGLPENLADMAQQQMRQQMGGQSTLYCLTPEDVEKGYEEMARQSQEEANCTFSRFDVDGRDIDAEMVCNPSGQGEMTMTLNGTGTSTGSEMEMAMRGDLQGMGEMTIRMKAMHERVGDCPG